MAEVGTAGSDPRGVDSLRATGAVVVADMVTHPLPMLQHPVGEHSVNRKSWHG